MFTVLLLSIGNLVVPIISYIWGAVRLAHSNRWSKIQRASLLLIFPAMLIVPAVALTGMRETTSSCGSRSDAPCPETITETTVSPRKVNPNSSNPDARATLEVRGPLRAGAVFEVTFTGALVRSRGAYLWVRKSGHDLVLLRGDGNPEIPMGFEEDPAKFSMLDDALSGATSSFVLPPTLPTGDYELCRRTRYRASAERSTSRGFEDNRTPPGEPCLEAAQRAAET